MNNKIITVLLLLVGIINFLPLMGVLSTEHLNKLYNISVTDNNLVILMRHRALLFGLIGGFIIYAAFNPNYQVAAFIMAFISMMGFILIAWSTTGYDAAISKIIKFDLLGLGLLMIAVILLIVQKRSS